MPTETQNQKDIAVIGMSCRFPGAKDVEIFWKNIVNSLETIHHFTRDELTESVPSTALDDKNYVRARGIIDNIDQFDANFFGYSAQDAKITDPQHRLFLECAHEALELAGCSPQKYNGLIGVYASMADSTYLQNNLLKNKKLLQSFDWFQARISTSLTTLSTQLSYKLNLKGPSVNITTACSSSLVVVASACNALLNYDCDVAIAGAASITVPQEAGYLYQEDGIESADGHCKAFDAKSNGTVFSNGLGVVILKRLDDAIQDGDYIHAVIKGWNINNDGSDKAGFSAPSINGQADCVASALAFAEINPDTIGYIEMHGTGTALGDPIEVKALTKAFNSQTDKKQFCAIGSVKTNIGHTDIASGMASLIKVVLSLEKQQIPPSLHYSSPNPEIDFPNTPFFVNTKLKKWNSPLIPRRAGVNASGIGGTNAFLILEEYNENKKQSIDNNKPQLLLLSAKTKTALKNSTQNIIEYLKNNTGISLKEAASTLQMGRTDFDSRQIIVCNDQTTLENLDSSHIEIKDNSPIFHPKLVFMFSGQASQYAGMIDSLYLNEPRFSRWIDICLDHLDKSLKESVKTFICSKNKNSSDDLDTDIIQPALFITEYSLAQFFIGLGIQPDALIGHSLGEYVAACVADVISLADCIKLICYRGKLMGQTLPGSMLALHINQNDLNSIMLASQKLSLASINSDLSYVISGDSEEINAAENQLKKQNIFSLPLKTKHAFHSNFMDPILEKFESIFEDITLNAPRIPYISNITGKWITTAETTNPNYWVKHLRSTVMFSDGIKSLINTDHNVFIEIGPGKTLVNFVKELTKNKPDVDAYHSLPTAKDEKNSHTSCLLALGWLWLNKINVDWNEYNKNEKNYRVPLPTYPFERKSYWIESDKNNIEFSHGNPLPYPEWFYEPAWIKTSLMSSKWNDVSIFENKIWILLGDNLKLMGEFSHLLLDKKQHVINVMPGDHFKKNDDYEYIINLREKKDYISLIKSIITTKETELHIINLLPFTDKHSLATLDLMEVEKIKYRCFYSSLFLAQALIEETNQEHISLSILGNEICSVLGDENIYPAKATAIGPCRVIPQEHPMLNIKLIDILSSDMDDKKNCKIICEQILLDNLLREKTTREEIIAYRHQSKWIQTFHPLMLVTKNKLNFSDNGVYIVTGGPGGIGTTLALHIAKLSKNPYFLLIMRSSFPAQETWNDWPSKHPHEHAINRKIKRLQQLQNLGAHIDILQADVSNPIELAKQINNIKKKYAHISGVIHAAGVAGGGLVQLKTSEAANKVLAPKVEGTYILTNLLRNEPLDFFLLCSSVSAVMGELSQVDYCSANACLDAFSQTTLLKNTKMVISVNWNTWREIGMAVDTERPSDITYLDRNNDISPEEGAKVFEMLLKNPYHQVIVSNQPLNSFIQFIYNSKEVEPILSHDSLIETKSDDGICSPKNDTEFTLTNLWREALGIDKISTEDDFFDLGGHSLMALRLLARIEKIFHKKINLSVLQTTKTIKKLAIELNSTPNKQLSLDAIAVPIRMEGRHPPLFCLHPVGGTIFCYFPLAKHLHFDCPIYGLPDPGLENTL